MRDVQCKCTRAIGTLFLLLGIASCERESVVEIECPPPPDDRIMVAIRAQGGGDLGTAEIVSDEYQLGTLLQTTATSGSVRTIHVLRGVGSAKVREVPVEVSALITKLGTRIDPDVNRQAARKGLKLSEWVLNRTKIDVQTALMRALEDPEKVLNDDPQAIELIRKEGAEHKFLIVSAIVYGTGVELSFDPGPRNPIGINAFRMNATNVHVGFACSHLTRFQKLYLEGDGEMIPMLLQYSTVKYDGRQIVQLRVGKDDKLEEHVH